MKIQLHKPNFDLKETQFLKNCIKTGWVSNQGKYVNLFKKKINQFTNSNYVVPTVNGTSALHVSLKLSNVKENDETKAKSEVEEMCKKLLANLVIEDYKII